jgi:hypothetical protein
MTTIDAAPTSLPESPGHATAEQVTTTVTGCSGAHVLLAACVLAEQFIPMATPFMADEPLRQAVDAALEQHSADHLLGWQQRVAPAEWSIRWAAARLAVPRLFPECPAATALPDLHDVNFVIAPAQRT